MTQAKNLRRNTLRENHCFGVLADQPLSKGGHGISTGLWNRKWCTENKTFAGRNLIIDKSYYWWNVELTLYFSPCCMYNSGYKSLEKNKVNGPRSLKKPGHPVSLSLSLYLSFFTCRRHPSWGYPWTLLRLDIGKWHPNRDPKVSPIFGMTRTPLRVLQTHLQKTGRERWVGSDRSKETPLVKWRNLGKADFLTD